MSVQPKDIGSENALHPDSGDLATWCLSCSIESVQCAEGEIIVLRVAGEVDLCTIPILHAALEEGLDRDPAHLVVDLAQMTFCSVRGLDLLTLTRRIAASTATGYAVTGVPPHIHRVWSLCWGDAVPIRYHNAAAALTAIRCVARHADLQTGQIVGTPPDRTISSSGPTYLPPERKAPTINRYGVSS